MRFLSELKRRNVLRMAALYAVAAWLIMQVAEVMIGLANLPDRIGPAVLGFLAVGFPIALLFSWFYEITPAGISLEKDVTEADSITHVTGRRLDFLVISLMSAALLLFAWDKWSVSVPPAHSIAVLPFENMSSDPEQEYFSDGISEEILHLLARIPKLRVTSRSSAFSFKGKNLDIPTMAAKLGVAHILEGSVRKSGGRLRITAQLIDVTTDTHLWSETYDRDLNNVFAIQDAIAAAVVAALKITLLDGEPKTLETNPEAYALYLQGRHFYNRGTKEALKRSEILFKQALATDPDYTPALVDLAGVYWLQGASAYSSDRPLDEAYLLARSTIEKALAIDPGNSRAYALLSILELFYGGDFAKALEYQNKAMALDPGEAMVLGLSARLNRELGRFDKAIDLYRQSIALDPLVLTPYAGLGYTLYLARRLDEAAEILNTAWSLEPGGLSIQFYLGQVLLAQGDVEAALEAMEKETSEAYRVWGLALVRHVQGDDQASDVMLEIFIDQHSEGRDYEVAELYAVRGEIDYAFEWLERAYDNHDPGLVSMLVDPDLANLYDDPRWQPMLDRMGFPLLVP